MKKKLFLFLSIIVLFISCKSEEQKQYDELIERSQTLYEKIKDKPDYLYSSNNYIDSKYMSILDEKMSIIYKSKELEDNSKIDDRPTSGQQQELIDYLSKIQSILTYSPSNSNNNIKKELSNLDTLNTKYIIDERRYKEVDKFGEKEWEEYKYDSPRQFYLDSNYNVLCEINNIVYTYDKGKLISEKKYISPYQETTQYGYDSSGNLTTKTETTINGISSIIRYKYQNNNKRKWTQYDKDGNMGPNGGRYGTENLDKNGRIISESWNRGIYRSLWNYKYDNFGNRIREVDKSDEFSSGSTVERIIKYKYLNNLWVEKITEEYDVSPYFGRKLNEREKSIRTIKVK
jgi:YD repeat-containing protein